MIEKKNKKSKIKDVLKLERKVHKECNGKGNNIKDDERTKR